MGTGLLVPNLNGHLSDLPVFRQSGYVTNIYPSSKISLLVLFGKNSRSASISSGQARRSGHVCALGVVSLEVTCYRCEPDYRPELPLGGELIQFIFSTGVIGRVMKQLSVVRRAFGQSFGDSYA